MTPAARIAAAIDLVSIVETNRTTPAPEIANAFFRARRYIGAGDRRAISERLWRCLRTRRRLIWWLGSALTPRLEVAASLLFETSTLADIVHTFSGARFAPPPLAPDEYAALARLEGHELDDPEMPDWLFQRLQASLGETLAAEALRWRA